MLYLKQIRFFNKKYEFDLEEPLLEENSKKVKQKGKVFFSLGPSLTRIQRVI